MAAHGWRELGDVGAFSVLPETSHGADHPPLENHREVIEFVHRRGDAIVGTYVATYLRRWHLEWAKLTLTQVASLRAAWIDRIFEYAPDSGAPSTFYVVKWVEPRFHPIGHRGDTLFRLSATFVEVSD